MFKNSSMQSTTSDMPRYRRGLRQRIETVSETVVFMNAPFPKGIRYDASPHSAGFPYMIR